jgi:outer membrane protein assembly factor BamB
MQRFDRLLLLTAVGAISCSPALVRAENWPQFRGPTGQGLSAERGLPVTWGGKNQENVLWAAPLKGNGTSSPIVWEDRVFVCTATWPPDVKDHKSTFPEQHVQCYRTSDGQLLWDVEVSHGDWKPNDFRIGPSGGYAELTPVTDGKLVYCAFGSATLAALDFQGKIVWQKEVKPCDFDCSMGSSPILYGKNVLLLCLQRSAANSRVELFDKQTGEISRWPLADTPFGHNTPLLIDVKGKPQLVFTCQWTGGPNALQSLDLDSGKLLWWCRGIGDVSSPAFGAGLVYFDSGRGGETRAVDPTGSGDVTATNTKWTGRRCGDLNSPIIVGDLLYRLQGDGVVRCSQMSDNKELYASRLEGITSKWASPVADADGNVYFASAGKSYVLKAGPKFEVLGTNDLEDANHCSPAISGGRIFLVGKKNVYCIGRKP